MSIVVQVGLLILKSQDILLTHADELLRFRPPVITQLMQLLFLFFKDEFELFTAAVQTTSVDVDNFMLEVLDLIILL